MSYLTIHKHRESSYLRAYKAPLHLSRTLYKSPTFYAKQTQFPKWPKMNVNLYVIEDYENKTAFRPQKNKPKQSQWIGNELKSPISPKLTNCPIYQRSYLYYATADLINAGTVNLTRIWNLRIFHSIISHRNTSLISDSPMPEMTKTDE